MEREERVLEGRKDNLGRNKLDIVVKLRTTKHLKHFMTATQPRTSTFVIVEPRPTVQLELSVIRKICYTKLPFFQKENINAKNIFIGISCGNWKQ